MIPVTCSPTVQCMTKCKHMYWYGKQVITLQFQLVLWYFWTQLLTEHHLKRFGIPCFLIPPTQQNRNLLSKVYQTFRVRTVEGDHCGKFLVLEGRKEGRKAHASRFSLEQCYEKIQKWTAFADMQLWTFLAYVGNIVQWCQQLKRGKTWIDDEKNVTSVL